MSVMYAVKEGISGFRRAKLAATGSIFTVTISLLLLVPISVVLVMIAPPIYSC